MGLVIGMDEAGYGPNLGPLVITATVWETTGAPLTTSFWSEFASIACENPARPGSSRVQIADSKVVHQAGRGLGPLERSVTTILGLLGPVAPTFLQLCQQLAADPAVLAAEPWFQEELPLPVATDLTETEQITGVWRELCGQTGIRLREIRSDLVLTRRFNDLSRDAGKGVALSRLSMDLLGRVWDGTEPALIICDKHGGRNRYETLLAELADGQFIFTREESTARSSYRIGESEVRFQTRAEEQFPVAVASMVSKYLREAAMVLFNQYWERQRPGLKPTKGYPVDALRFQREIADTPARQLLADDDIWRAR